ncbi:MAG TPA: GNAT family N-acetyltransferase [Spirochaetota bacterium]|nr:GNAT family N-acetyltransferase [Spirochaetota bacterium]HPC41802.1 GNAT family N-acetyltransferase [Spirochaetota bacterium]HPL16140.1 GNAT family N-acetyltransferase [Spirochaetota bacterium]HQF07524.1 GNAT family N-acetyltransferase [Spirochaetota bacterium]HQH96255.1 GNAT family N-acetyltransferase [Spirochaetota bacterium]
MFIIEEITEKDLPGLAGLYEQLANRPVNMAAMKETFEKIRRSGDYYLLGAKSDGGILVGTVRAVVCHDMAKECRPFMILENFVVDGDWHRRGAGSLLMREAEAIGRERNCLFVQFCSSSHRTGAHAF